MRLQKSVEIDYPEPPEFRGPFEESGSWSFVSFVRRSQAEYNNFFSGLMLSAFFGSGEPVIFFFVFKAVFDV